MRRPKGGARCLRRGWRATHFSKSTNVNTKEANNVKAIASLEQEKAGNMTAHELIEALEEVADDAGSWDVTDELGRVVTGVRLTRKGVVVEVAE